MTSQRLVGALAVTFVMCGALVACGPAVVSGEPEPTIAERSLGLCGDGWSATGRLAEGREIATATRLQDGTVLMAGGSNDDGLVARAERYDPVTDTWSAAGTLNVPRIWHRAVALRDGRVLVAGGLADAGPTNTVEIYNPATNAWSLAASMFTAAYGLEVTPLADGRVLAFGGIDTAEALATAEIYDPARNSWTRVGSMATGRYLPSSALLRDGEVLVAGGYDGTAALSSVEIFNPSSGTWSAAASMTAARYASGIALLRDGRALVVGGTEQSPGAEIFNPVTGAWTPTQDMVQGLRWYFETRRLSDGRVLVAGGVGPNSFLDEVEIFDPALGLWTQLDALTMGRHVAASAELPDGRILIAGGIVYTVHGATEVTNTAETYLPCVVNLPPVAVCANRFLSAGPTCTGTANVDNGSYDPDQGPGPLQLSQSPEGPYGLGSTPVTLTASDGQLQGTCSATVTVVDTTPPQVTCPDDDPNVPGNQVYLECVNGGATGAFTAQATDNCGGANTVTCAGSGAPLPFGQTNVTCTATDGSQNQASCNVQAIVRDTQPPVPGASKGLVLSTVDGKLQEVSLMDCADFAVDACNGRLNPLKDYALITDITSDEPEDAPGDSDGNTLGDMQIKKPWLALLRAERDRSGDGRVYTLHYVVHDPSGNATTGSCQVGVPRAPGAPAVDSGPGYCVDNPNVPGNACP